MSFPPMLKAMRKLRFEAKAEGKWKGGDRNIVFHAGTGKPYYHTTPSQQWKIWCERNKFRIVSLHGLRHTNATYLLGQGASIKEIQHRLRHSTSQVTTDTYAHVTKKLSRKTTTPSMYSILKFAPNPPPKRKNPPVPFKSGNPFQTIKKRKTPYAARD